MPAIVLLTDFGLKDHFVGVMKGVMLTLNPRARIIDLTHGIRPHQITDAAFKLLAAFFYFPKGTIFTVVVDPGVGSKRLPVVIKTKNYLFIGPDNGVLSLAASRDGIKEVIALTNRKYFLKNVSATFHGRDIFAPVAAHVSRGCTIKSLGKPIKTIKKLTLAKAKSHGKDITGEIISIDQFGNLITNITKSRVKSRFHARLRGEAISKIQTCYDDARANEPFFIVGSFGTLEVSLKAKSAQKYFAARVGDKIKVDLR